MAQQQFSSEEDISKHYDGQIRGTDDPLEQANLRAERAERLAEFKDRKAATAQREAWIAQAAAQHKIEADYIDLIRGDTAEEIAASAEKLAKLSQRAEPTGADLYGGSTAGGGTPPPQRSKDPVGEQLTEFEQKFNNREPMHPVEFQRYVRERLGRQAFSAMRTFGKKHIWHGPELKDIPEYDRT